MVNLNYEDRNRDFRKECISYLQKIFSSDNLYESQQRYETLTKNIEEKLRKSGHSKIPDNIMSVVLEEISKLLNKQL